MEGERFQRTTFSHLISDGAIEIGDGYRAKNDELGGDGLIFLRARHVTDTHIDFEGVERFHAHLEPQVRSKLAKPGDAVITTKGNSTGRTTFVSSSMPPFVYSPHLSYWRSLNPTRIEGGFLRYWSKGPEFREQLAGMKASTDMAPYLSLIDQKRLQITLPPVSEQHAIAHILGTLDDKIELNRRMNETLEAIAQAMFKSWFVDFDPVHAKASGEAPDSICHRLGLTRDLLALFPDDFQESELGGIPRGWEVAPIGNAVKAVGGGTPSTKNNEYWDGGFIHWATPKDLAGLSSPILIDTERKVTEQGLAQISSELFPAGTLLMSSRAPVGYLAISTIPVAVNQGFIAMVCDGPVSNYYALNWCENNMDAIKQRARGTTFAEISKSTFRPIPILLPPSQLMRRFTSAVEPIYSAMTMRLRENDILTMVRNTLLPKLLSGELRVKEAKKVVEEAL